MSKKVQQLSTDNKMVPNHQQDVDPTKSLILARAFQCCGLRLPRNC